MGAAVAEDAGPCCDGDSEGIKGGAYAVFRIAPLARRMSIAGRVVLKVQTWHEIFLFLESLFAFSIVWREICVHFVNLVF